jgi:hypothetical protein
MSGRREYGDVARLVLLYFGIAALDIVLFAIDGLAADGSILDVADKSASVTACIVTLIGLVLIYHQLKMQADGSDIASIFTITSQINDASYRLNFSVQEKDGVLDSEQWQTLFRNLMTLYESACYCFNEDMFQNKAKSVLGDYLRTALNEIYANESLVSWVEELKQEKPGALAQIDLFRATPAKI